MGIVEQIQALGQRVSSLRDMELTEEGTKNALIMPLLRALGYDVFDPSEVVPEFTADIGIKKGEKVDYGIFRHGMLIMLIECKTLGASLDRASSQLYRYFNTTDARIAVLTDGARFDLYSDLDEVNRMDPDPFLRIDLESLTDFTAGELVRLSKPEFDLDAVIEAARKHKLNTQMAARIAEEFENPSEPFVRSLAEPIVEGRMTKARVEHLREITRSCLRAHVRRLVDERLKAALSRAAEDTTRPDHPEETALDSPHEQESETDKLHTTLEELEGYFAVKAIVRDMIDVERVIYRDAKSYFAILLDDNNRKPICRLWFNGRTKYLGVFNENKQETRVPIDGPDSLFAHTNSIRASLGYRLDE